VTMLIIQRNNAVLHILEAVQISYEVGLIRRNVDASKKISCGNRCVSI
jgi:hypothetical protein